MKQDIQQYEFLDDLFVRTLLKSLLLLCLNRCHENQKFFHAKHWFYVGSLQNPADVLLSPGCLLSKLEHTLWFSGPSLLHEQMIHFGNGNTIGDVSAEVCLRNSGQVLDDEGGHRQANHFHDMKLRHVENGVHCNVDRFCHMRVM